MSKKMKISIRLLGGADTLSFKRIRLQSLQESPLAFSESYEDEANKTDAEFEAELKTIGSPAESFVLGTFSEASELIGFVKFRRDIRSKARHKAMLHGMYLNPNYRGKGIGKRLLEQMLQYAMLIEGLEQIHLWVLISDNSVVDFYKKCCFENQGTVVKQDLKIGYTYVDAMYMVHYLNKNV
jgi:RimJ/RimL family protein N-acetyltransferase